MRKIVLITCLAACSLFYACQQELPDILSQAQQCRIETGYYDNNQDSLNFIYSDDGRLVKLTDDYGYYLYTYNGDRIATRNYFDTTINALVYVDSAFYDASGRLTELRTMDISGALVDTFAVRYVFQYQNNQLSKVLNIESWDNGTVNFLDTFPSLIYWNAAGNIEKLVHTDKFGDPTDSILYLHDANPNYFKVAHPHFFLFDPNIRIHVGLEAHFAYYYSKNNVINTNMYGSFDNEVTYDHDSTNRMTLVEMAGIEYARYRYKCP